MSIGVASVQESGKAVEMREARCVCLRLAIRVMSGRGCIVWTEEARETNRRGGN